MLHWLRVLRSSVTTSPSRINSKEVELGVKADKPVWSVSWSVTCTGKLVGLDTPQTLALIRTSSVLCLE